MTVRQRVVVVANKGCASCERFEEHDAERVDICAPIHFLAFALFGGHIFGRADAGARTSEPAASGQHFRNTEV